MPYITQARRKEIMQNWDKLKNAGELNFYITMAVQAYMQQHGESYQHFNDCIGALEGAKLELYRRRIAPYEDKKIKQNGDVY